MEQLTSQDMKISCTRIDDEINTLFFEPARDIDEKYTFTLKFKYDKPTVLRLKEYGDFIRYSVKKNDSNWLVFQSTPFSNMGFPVFVDKKTFSSEDFQYDVSSNRLEIIAEVIQSSSQSSQSIELSTTLSPDSVSITKTTPIYDILNKHNLNIIKNVNIYNYSDRPLCILVNNEYITINKNNNFIFPENYQIAEFIVDIDTSRDKFIINYEI